MEKEFKVLVLPNGEYIDIRLLRDGLYTCEIPVLYNKDKTIDDLVASALMLEEKEPAFFDEHLGDSYVENLKKCELRLVTLP